MKRQLSATAIGNFKACPIRYYLGYVLGIRLAEEKESQRIGTNWHKGLEIIDREPGRWCLCAKVDSEEVKSNPDCIICNGTGTIPDDPLAAAIRYATKDYLTVPDWADATAWAVEREFIANTLAAYKWFYGTNQYKVLATEKWFDFLIEGEVRLVGKIDKIVEHPLWGPMIWENKSTGKSIDSGSSYWGRLHLDMQTSIYVNAARDLQMAGELPGIPKDGKLVAGLVHDVWHKATIRPKKLTQAETKKFLKERTYFNQAFAVECDPSEDGIRVNGWPTVVTLGAEPKSTKKNPNPERPFAIRETPAMFGARLLQDIGGRPEFYFARKPIPRSDAQLQSARNQVWHLHKDMEHKIKTGHWWTNEFSCESPYTCDYCPICFNSVDVSQGQVPPGFRRLKSFSHLDSVMGG